MTQCIAGIYTYDDFHITLKLLDLTLDFIGFQTIIQNLLQVPLIQKADHPVHIHGIPHGNNACLGTALRHDHITLKQIRGLEHDLKIWADYIDSFRKHIIVFTDGCGQVPAGRAEKYDIKGLGIAEGNTAVAFPYANVHVPDITPLLLMDIQLLQVFIQIPQVGIIKQFLHILKIPVHAGGAALEFLGHPAYGNGLSPLVPDDFQGPLYVNLSV